MSRRSRKGVISLQSTQDPGKDLFAYLFLLIMVFSFMLLMSMEEKTEKLTGQKAPRQESSSGKSSITSVSNEKIGKLIKENGQIYLLFGEKKYRPKEDLDMLEKDNIIVMVPGADDKKNRMIYIEEDRGSKVFLTEYLAAFQYLSQKGISVAFAERMK